MERDKDIRKELEEIAPLLAKLEKPVEELPYGALDCNRRAIMSRIHEEEQAQPWHEKVLSLFSNPRFNVPAGIAAALLISFFIWKGLGPAESELPETYSLDDIGAEEGLAYVEANLYQFDEDQLALALDDEDLDAWMNELILEEMASEEALESPSYELFNDDYTEDLF
jgi:hypothetical protein